jgi:hypothetical protein
VIFLNQYRVYTLSNRSTNRFNPQHDQNVTPSSEFAKLDAKIHRLNEIKLDKQHLRKVTYALGELFWVEAVGCQEGVLCDWGGDDGYCDVDGGDDDDAVQMICFNLICAVARTSPFTRAHHPRRNTAISSQRQRRASRILRSKGVDAISTGNDFASMSSFNALSLQRKQSCETKHLFCHNFSGCFEAHDIRFFHEKEANCGSRALLSLR